MLLIRHAESEWNLHFGQSRIDPGIPDPVLTAEGLVQAEAIAGQLRGSGIRRLLSSPYRRTLQTATIISKALGGVEIEIEPLVRERRAFSCDTGSAPEQLKRLYPALDFNLLEARWWGDTIESITTMERRVATFLGKAREIADRDSLAVVTHWGFIRCATGDEVGNTGAVRLELG
jgi:broad specificity phosphatase PhoE